MNIQDTFKLMQEISFLTPEEKFRILKELGAETSFENYVRKEYIGYWNEE